MNASFTIWTGLLLVLFISLIDGIHQTKTNHGDSPTDTEFQIDRSYTTNNNKDYQQLEDSLRNFNDDSKSTLVVIDTEDEDNKQNVKRSEIEKRNNEDFDKGFTIIVDREELNENDVKKDQTYQDMERSYNDIQQKFGEEIKQPVEEKHVRVIVITPKDGITELEEHKEEPGTSKHQQTELDLDIAKLQRVKEQMNTLNNEEKHMVADALEEKVNSTFEDINPMHQEEPGESRATPTTLVEDMELLDEIKTRKNENNNNDKMSDQNQELLNVSENSEHKHSESIKASNEPPKQNTTTVDLHEVKLIQPPGNPHPQQNAIEEHYKNKTIERKTADKTADKKSPSETSNSYDNDFIVEHPKLPIAWLPKKNDSSDEEINPTSSNIMEEEGSMKDADTNKKPTTHIKNTHKMDNQTSSEETSKHNKKKGFKMLEPIHHQAKTNDKEDGEDIGKTIKQSSSDQKKIKSINNGTLASSNDSKKLGDSSSQNEKVITISKADAIIQFLNKDPLESWRFPFNTLKALNLDAGLIRSGLVYPGYIERLKGVMKRAIAGQDVTLSIIGGSISAGGGLYKDRQSIEGLYYKGVVDWWNQWIAPVTGSKMKINNVAIGSIGTDYFSYCVKNHIKTNTDIVIWELAANDYNRYKTTATKGARPLERFTRIVLNLPKKPALMFVNFFKGIDYKNVRDDCPNFEDQQEHTIASYYHVPTLSWRKMVCGGLVHQTPGFLLADLFSLDQYHPSLKGHAQTALLILLHLRHVMRAVLQYAIKHKGEIPDFSEQYTIPDPLFIGPKNPEPFCWSLIRPDEKNPVKNSLEVHIASNVGFSVEYATNFPIRFDKVVCWKSQKPMSTLQFVFSIPKTPDNKDRRYEVAITTHSRWGGAAYIWLDDKKDQPVVIQEGRPGDPGKRTQVDSIANDVSPGTHFLNLWAKDGGFCLAAIMIDAS